MSEPKKFQVGQSTLEQRPLQSYDVRQPHPHTHNSDQHHTRLQLFSDFRLVFLMPLVQGSHLGSIQPENEVGKIFHWGPPEIQAPGTPGESQGTKILGSKIFSYHPQLMLFYTFWGFVSQKMMKYKNNQSFQAHFAINKGKAQIDWLFLDFIIFTGFQQPVNRRLDSCSSCSWDQVAELQMKLLLAGKAGWG